MLKRVEKDARSGDAKPASGGGGGGPIADSYKVVITCGDEAHQTEVLDAIDNGLAERLGELLKGAECRALVA